MSAIVATARTAHPKPVTTKPAANAQTVETSTRIGTCLRNGGVFQN